MEYLQYTENNVVKFLDSFVLNLVISGIPSIRTSYVAVMDENFVLNLVISGIPSILVIFMETALAVSVLNLVISGIPSILNYSQHYFE